MSKNSLPGSGQLSTDWTIRFQRERVAEENAEKITRPLTRDGGETENHRAPEARNSPRPGPEIFERQRVAKDSTE